MLTWRSCDLADRSKTLALITPIPCSRRTYHQHYRYMTSPGLPRRPIRRGRSCALTVGGRNDIERPVAREWQNAAVDATSWLAGRARGVAVGRHEQKGIDRGMTIQRLSIPIVETTKQNGPVPVDLVEAMSALAGARSTRTIIKAYKAAGVTSNLIIPLVSDCPVDSARLGRAMRRVWKAALDEAKSGDTILVELRPQKNARIVEIIAGPTVEMRPDMPTGIPDR